MLRPPMLEMDTILVWCHLIVRSLTVLYRILGMYARLDASKYFDTIVTNVHPTAKQSRVINPWVRSCLYNLHKSRAHPLK